MASEIPVSNLLAAVVVEPAGQHTASVIWMHGLGADGHDFEAIVPQLDLPTNHGIKFIFPHAQMRPITINNGYVMRGWYDILSLDGIEREEDCEGISDSTHKIEQWISEERAQGIPSERIILAGFSQGGVIAFNTALRHKEKLAGIMALSTYVGCGEKLLENLSEINRSIPIYMAHGSNDDILPIELGQRSRDALIQQGYSIDWHEYPMPHSVHPQEIQDISQWLNETLLTT